MRSLFNKFFQHKKKEEITALKVERVGFGQRLKNSGKKLYTAKVAITYEGKPIRQFEVNVKAFSRDNAAYKINQDLALKLLSTKQNKKKKS